MIKRFDQYNEEFWPLPVSEDIPTAEEFYLNPNPYITKKMIEFAKLHVEAALKSAAKSLESEYPNPSVNKNLIECYPITNIK